MNLNKRGGRVWTGFIWLVSDTTGEPLWKRSRPFGFSTGTASSGWKVIKFSTSTILHNFIDLTSAYAASNLSSLDLTITATTAKYPSNAVMKSRKPYPLCKGCKCYSDVMRVRKQCRSCRQNVQSVSSGKHTANCFLWHTQRTNCDESWDVLVTREHTAMLSYFIWCHLWWRSLFREVTKRWDTP